jgi:hypothetical protein
MESGYMKAYSVLDILAGATRRLQRTSGSRGASAMKRRLKAFSHRASKTPRMHGASHRPPICGHCCALGAFGNR